MLAARAHNRCCAVVGDGVGDCVCEGVSDRVRKKWVLQLVECPGISTRLDCAKWCAGQPV